ncbi:MAG: bifunctional phosphoribosylaminoimidazolecarboxamide formyltransferase/IMP cyclohydrolase [Nitrospinota bacterium]|nr:bifunctional phosphoribosylaminoimidazolecarboxamide formyltransferase/IMP cyclohydrolase [Nitrospinota bacterium]
MSSIKRVLISVSDKSGLAEFAQSLQTMGAQILSTGGTAKFLRDAGLMVTDVSDYTGFPEIMDGRVKTLHPKVHGGILARRDLDSHMSQMADNGIDPIDMVVVNLYPFEKTIAKPDVAFDEAVENIDIGGPAMVRSAAKNHAHVAVVVDPADYAVVAEEMKMNDGALTGETMRTLAAKAFDHTAWYDGRIASYMNRRISSKVKFPNRMIIQLEKSQALRYGENPHQDAALYTMADNRGFVAQADQLHGKELSFNNIVDMSAAYDLAFEFSEPAVAIIKHTNPSGVAVNQNLVQAYLDARECDPVSAFGGVIAVNREVDDATAEEIAKLFVEVLIAPSYSVKALAKLKEKKNIRLIQAPSREMVAALTAKFLSGAALLQDDDSRTLNEEGLRVVSQRPPTDDEMKALRFAWTVAKHVKSNAIVYADSKSTIGVGAGQMSRVDSARIAHEKARRPLTGAVMASDAFFPFRDGIDEAAKVGIKAVIQPGGSMRDEEVIAAADEHGMAMVFTGMRHFRH